MRYAHRLRTNGTFKPLTMAHRQKRMLRRRNLGVARFGLTEPVADGRTVSARTSVRPSLLQRLWDWVRPKR